ncbi:MAG: acetyltransferase [Pseudomonadota bacterium]
MKQPSRFALIGGGGLGLEVAGYIHDTLQDHLESLSLWDDNPPTPEPALPLLSYRGQINDIKASADEAVLICIGDTQLRTRIAQQLERKRIKLGRFIHPSAIISSQAILADGCIILPFSCVSYGAMIGSNTLINSHVGIGHHATVQAHSVISPHSLIAGHTTIGEGVFIGSGAVITPGKTIGRHTKITAGSVIYRNAPENSFLSGNPAKNLCRGS